jgi:hypothetical protein
MYTKKFMQYESRAKQIKKQAIDTPPPVIDPNAGAGANAPAGGTAAAGVKPKTK